MELKTTIIQASIRGDKHETIPNQDYINVFENDEFLISTVSDGLGSSIYSLEGAQIACKSVIDEIQKFLLSSELQFLNNMVKERWKKEIESISSSVSDYRTTNSFIAVFKKEKKIIVGQIGDVLVSLRMDGLFRYLESTTKDFSNETVCLGSGRDENFKLALFEFGHTFDFLIATDGIADELQTEKIETLHDYFKNKFQNIEESRRNDALKCDLEEFLTEKNNDDKSMIFIWSNKN
jgi:serine/threonine protein phosphatase PrpC